MVTIIIIDDHPLARWGLEHLFAADEQVRILASVPSPADLPRRATADIVIIDLYLQSHEPALDAIRDLSASQRVLVISASGRQSDVLAALKAGAQGYLTKDAGDDEITRAVRTVAGGGFYLSASVANYLQSDLEDQQPPGRAALSPREQLALSYIARGFTHAQTATRMNIRPATVDSYIERIRGKLGLGNKADLTRIAIELNLTSDDEPPQPGTPPLP